MMTATQPLARGSMSTCWWQGQRSALSSRLACSRAPQLAPSSNPRATRSLVCKAVSLSHNQVSKHPDAVNRRMAADIRARRRQHRIAEIARGEAATRAPHNLQVIHDLSEVHSFVSVASDIVVILKTTTCHSGSSLLKGAEEMAGGGHAIFLLLEMGEEEVATSLLGQRLASLGVDRVPYFLHFREGQKMAQSTWDKIPFLRRLEDAQGQPTSPKGLP